MFIERNGPETPGPLPKRGTRHDHHHRPVRPGQGHHPHRRLRRRLAPRCRRRPHKAVSQGTTALSSATGLTGHILAAKSRDIRLPGKTAAELADHVLPALTAAMTCLASQPGEAANFRDTILVAIEAATRSGKAAPTPAVTAMAGKIAAALDS